MDFPDRLPQNDLRHAMVWAMAATVADVHGGAPVNRTVEDVNGQRNGIGSESHDGISPLDDELGGGEFFDDSAPDTLRPEQSFFNDPATDRLMGVVWALATEVYVLRDRLQLLEETLEGSDLIKRAALDVEASPQALMDKAADREAFVAHLMDNLMGVQMAKGPVR